MKTGLTRIALISSFTLISPFLIFAGSQQGTAKQPATEQTETNVLIRTRNLIVETPRQPACVVEGKHTCPRWQDTQAFHK